MFCEKNEQMSDLLKKMSDLLIHSFLVSDLSNSLIFGEQPERIAHGRSFMVSDLSDRSHRSSLVRDLSDSLTSSTKNEGMSEWLI